VRVDRLSFHRRVRRHVRHAIVELRASVRLADAHVLAHVHVTRAVRQRRQPLLGADNYACEGNKCRWLGCNDTAECTAANNSPAWTCVTLPGATMRSCIHTCTTPADCATASAPYDADNYACTDNLCIWQGCNTTAECATVDPDWVCDE
jgi:hypothetical protein